MLTSLLTSVEAAYAGLRILRDRTPGTPAGDQDDPHEANTWNLPNGNPIRRKVKYFGRRQFKKLLGIVSTIGMQLPESFPSLTPWNVPMASAMTPLISAYWDEAGKTTRARLGLDPERWEVHDPHLHEMVSRAALSFCRTTNETTDLDLQVALDRLRQELLEGLVDRGDTIPELTARVKSVFKDLSTWRAEMIGRTEASRAVHAASLQSAKESGVVQRKKWLVSENSCDKCRDLAAQVNADGGIPLDDMFAHEGGNPVYSRIPHPPLHPHCRCSIIYVLDDEYERLLKEHPPVSDNPSLGPELIPEPKPKAPAIAFTTHGDLPDKDVEEMRKAIEALPAATLKRIEEYGGKWTFAKNWNEYDPVHAQLHPDGWSAGQTWANTDGSFIIPRKTALACKQSVNPYDGKMEESYRRVGVMRHETGHMLDWAMGRASLKAAFRQAYQEDVAALLDTDKLGLAYYLQAGDRGREEVFAEVFGQLHGGGAGGPMLSHFPRCAAIVLEWSEKGFP